MSRISLLILIGLLVILAPFLGLPMSVLSFLLPALGIGTLIIAVALRAPRTQQASSSHGNSPITAP